MEKKAILAAHSDSVRVPEVLVRQAPEPAFTRTWRPFSHGTVLDCLGAACGKAGLAVTRREYSMTKSGTRLFGVWEVGRESDPDVGCAIGLRNSTDKHFAVGLCAGERVFVCDNLVFSSDFVLFRMHTGQLTREEIEAIAEEALRAVLKQFDELKHWHSSLRETRIADEQAALLTVAALRQGLIPPTAYLDFYELYFGKDSKYDSDLYGWHGAVTELYTKQSLLTVQYKNVELNQFIKHSAPKILDHAGHAPGAKRLDFEAIKDAAISAHEEEAILSKESSRTESKAILRKIRREIRKPKSAAPGVVFNIAEEMKFYPKGRKFEIPCGCRLCVESGAKNQNGPTIPGDTQNSKIDIQSKPQIILDVPKWHNDPEKSMAFIAANRRKAGTVVKVIVRRLCDGWQTELWGEKAVVMTYGFAIQRNGLQSKFLYRLLDEILKFGKFQSVFMTKLEPNDLMKFEKRGAFVERRTA